MAVLTVDKLRDFGADVDEGLHRCMNKESFYLRLTQMVLADEKFSVLRESVPRQDRKRAFEAAHTLKGALGNLSLKPLYLPACELTELLRHEGGDPAAIAEQYEELFVQFDALNKLADS